MFSMSPEFAFDIKHPRPIADRAFSSKVQALHRWNISQRPAATVRLRLRGSGPAKVVSATHFTLASAFFRRVLTALDEQVVSDQPSPKPTPTRSLFFVWPRSQVMISFLEKFRPRLRF
jgi:hypothetical protein